MALCVVAKDSIHSQVNKLLTSRTWPLRQSHGTISKIEKKKLMTNNVENENNRNAHQTTKNITNFI